MALRDTSSAAAAADPGQLGCPSVLALDQGEIVETRPSTPQLWDG